MPLGRACCEPWGFEPFLPKGLQSQHSTAGLGVLAACLLLSTPPPDFEPSVRAPIALSAIYIGIGTAAWKICYFEPPHLAEMCFAHL